MGVAKPGLSKLDLAVFGVVLLVVVLIFNRGGGGAGLEPIPLGAPMPEFLAEGWLNVGEPPGADADGSPRLPSRENLKGKVVLVDAWATWCPPCRASMPKLAKIHQQYESLGVQFVGLTPETAAERSAIEGFVGSVEGFTWPVGYGANLSLDMLGVEVLPTMVVFDKRGTATWSSTSTQGLEAALDEALAR